MGALYFSISAQKKEKASRRVSRLNQAPQACVSAPMQRATALLEGLDKRLPTEWVEKAREVGTLYERGELRAAATQVLANVTVSSLLYSSSPQFRPRTSFTRRRCNSSSERHRYNQRK